VACIPPTLDGWVYIIPIHGPLDGPLYTRAQYTPTVAVVRRSRIYFATDVTDNSKTLFLLYVPNRYFQQLL